MKHLIIVNGAAGKHVALDALIKSAFENEKATIYHTSGPRSAVTYLRNYFAKEKELTRVYACGGDGTLHEVVNGLIGVNNAELALYACGTGNDFAKIYGGKDKFNEFESLKKWKASPIDITKVSGASLKEPYYSINVVNYGFDAVVGAKGNENKLKHKSNPYGFKNAIIPAILHGRHNRITVYGDGVKLNNGRLLLSSISQGKCVGGEYLASPKSVNDDGVFDVIVVKCMSLIRLLTSFFKQYHDGKHLDKPSKKIIYKQCKTAKIISPYEIDICLDGEMLKGREFDFECLEGAINFVKPE